MKKVLLLTFTVLGYVLLALGMCVFGYLQHEYYHAFKMLYPHDNAADWGWLLVAAGLVCVSVCAWFYEKLK